MSNEIPAVHPSLDNSEVQAAVDAQTDAVVGDNEVQKAVADQAVKAAAEGQKPEEDKFAQKFAALSRKEKALRQKELQAEARVREMEAKLAEMEQTYKSKYIDPDVFKKNPLKIAAEHGLTADQMAEMILNDGKRTPERLLEEYEQKMQAKLQELENKLTAKEQAEKEAKLQQATQSFKSEIASFVESNTEYELIRANDATELVYDTIEEYYNKTLEENGEGTILSHKEACDLVEEYLLEEAKKVWSKANNKLAKIVQPEKPAEQTQQRQSQTLSNAMAATSKAAVKTKLSDDESKAEAAKLIRWID